MTDPLPFCMCRPPSPPPLCVCSAHTGPVWSLAALPDSSGFVSGSADHDIKFWEWGVSTDPETGAKQLGISNTR
jgi:U3 small nucleolar RNA-associated protein 12